MCLLFGTIFLFIQYIYSFSQNEPNGITYTCNSYKLKVCRKYLLITDKNMKTLCSYLICTKLIPSIFLKSKLKELVKNIHLSNSRKILVRSIFISHVKTLSYILND